MRTVAVTDYTFDTLEIETSILEPLGCRIVSQKSAADLARLAALVKDADYVITQFAPLNAGVIGAMDSCRLIVRYGIGVDNVDLAAAAARRIPVCNVPDYCTDEVADHALAMILALTRRISENAARVRSGGWGLGVPLEAMHALKDMAVGIVGFGRIGREVASRLSAFKCRILVSDPAVSASDVRAQGFSPVSLDELFAHSDLVTLHCPSTETTARMINSHSIAKMKRGALLVNVSRGTLVATQDLVEALKSGALGAAALDVTDPEPIGPDHPVVKLTNVVISSHVASMSPSAMTKLRSQAAHIVAAALQGGKPPNVVNGVVS